MLGTESFRWAEIEHVQVVKRNRRLKWKCEVRIELSG